MPVPETQPVDYRVLMKKVEQLVDAMERDDEDTGRTIQAVTEAIVGKFRQELGLFGGRIYERHGGSYRVESTFGEAKNVPAGLLVPSDYPPVLEVLKHGTVYMDRDDSGVDPQIEQQLGVEKFAAVEIADGRYLLAFNVAPGHDRQDILFSLGILRHSINQMVRRERMEGIFRQARKIQASILPKSAPQHGPFDIAGRSLPLESVGGDYFDYIPLTDKILGLAVADVSGHGLPAALQVRDIYTGLRMGLGRDFKIVRTVERLNAIIHESTLTSRFVSLFYGELEVSGGFIYVNAGHPPPVHLAANGEVRELFEGGAVLGPLGQATYERGFVSLKPGDVMVLYTDGIIEARGEPEGEGWDEYGGERLLAVLRANRTRSAAEIVDAIYRDVAAFGRGRQPLDDRTVVVVRYPE